MQRWLWWRVRGTVMVEGWGSCSTGGGGEMVAAVRMVVVEER